jgi:sulfate/thiosulfate transport system substrate-binding protein
MTRIIKISAPLAVLAALALAFAVTRSTAQTDGSKTTINLVAFSTPKAAYAELIKAFGQTAAGKDVSFSQSYGASGDQARAVAAGQPADVVALSLAPDVFPLVKARIVSARWNKNRWNGMVADSVVSLLVRKGNPKHVRGWGDLTRKGIQVVTPNPFTSGGARWNVMAAYGAKRRNGATDRQAIRYLNQLFHHVVSQDKSARDALTTFAQGRGDVLVDYENEAIFAAQNGLPSTYLIPRQTILIENPIALTKSGSAKPAARAFVAFLRSPKAQAIWAKNGYRPVVKSVLARSHFARPAGLFTIRQLGLGGWAKVQKRFFDPRSSVMATIERSLGVGTGG